MGARLSVALALFAAVAFGADAPAVTRAEGVLRPARVDGGTLPSARLGLLVYDVLGSKLVFSDGGSWAPATTAAAPAGQYAIRFNATGDRVQSTAPANLPLTAVWFARIETDRNDYSTFLAWSNAAGGWWILQTDGTGTEPKFCDNGAGGCTLPSFEHPNMTAGTWYCLAAVLTTTDSPDTRIYLATVSGVPAKYGAASGHNATAMTPTTFSLGANVDFGEQLNGDLAGVKVWAAELSDAEVQTECAQLAPARSSNLWAYYPLQTVAAMNTDASGNGRNMTNPGSAGTYTQVAGPFP